MKVTKRMSSKRIAKRIKLKPFVKFVNYNHLLPTRYLASDLDLKAVVSEDKMSNQETRKQMKLDLKKTLQER